MKKLFASLLLISLAAAGCNTTTSYQPQTLPAQQQSALPTQINSSETLPNQSQNTGLSNDNTYQNSQGNTVYSPAYELKPDVVPEGASARCADRTYSFSQSRRGTCSHHGGVSEWLY